MHLFYCVFYRCRLHIVFDSDVIWMGHLMRCAYEFVCLQAVCHAQMEVHNAANALEHAHLWHGWCDHWDDYLGFHYLRCVVFLVCFLLLFFIQFHFCRRHTHTTLSIRCFYSYYALFVLICQNYLVGFWNIFCSNWNETREREREIIIKQIIAMIASEIIQMAEEKEGTPNEREKSVANKNCEIIPINYCFFFPCLKKSFSHSQFVLFF